MKKVKLLLTIVSLLICFIGVSQDIETGLVGYYPFNANTNDYSTYENHGDFPANSERTTDRHDVPFAAYEFDNRTDVITVPAASQQDFIGDFTISLWAYPSDSGIFEMLSKGGSGFIAYQLTISGIGNIIFRIRTTDGDFSIELPGNFTLNEWQMFTGVRSGNTLYLYRNDVLIAQAPITGTNMINTGDLSIGIRIPYFDPIEPRKLDDLRLYNRALTSVDIDALYQYKDICPTGPVVINSQADLSLYQQNYPDCTSLPQGLLIEGNDVNDSTVFDNLLSVFGDITIQNNPNLVTLVGLEHLLGIFDGDILIENNEELVSIELFNMGSGYSLENRVVEIKDNPSLLSLDSFDSVREPSSFILDNNDSLDDLIGLTLINVDSLYIGNNDGLINLIGINSLNSFGSLVIDGNPNLESLEGMNNVSPTDGVFIRNNNNLVDISGLNISPININGVLEISENDNLSVCSTFLLCNYLNEFPEVSIFNNNFGCNSIEELIISCDEDFNYLSGEVLFDFNENDCSNSDIGVPNILLEISNGTQTFNVITYESGSFSTFLGLGTFAISIIPESLPNYFEFTPVSQEVTFSGYGNTEFINFCVSSSQEVEDLKISLLPLNEARPGFDAYYQIVYENVGTTVLSGDVKLIFDDARQTFLNAIPTEDNIAGNTITWSYNNLLPFQSRIIEGAFNTLPPPTNEDGDVLNFEVTINPVVDDETPLDNVYGFEQIIVNSQDPNDKQVMQGAAIFEAQVGEYLDYIVRFQNVGTADAINVRVDDLLSDNLDLNTFRILSSSHDYRVEIVNGNQLSFIFEGINLPPESSNPEGSQGFIAFQVKSKSDLNVGDSVANFANIYFDFNAAIVTNTVVTTVVENLGVSDVDWYNSVNLIPNPVSEMLTISVSENTSIKNVTVYSLLGIKLIETSNNHLDFSNFQQGIYFVNIETDQGTVVKRIIKE